MYGARVCRIVSKQAKSYNALCFWHHEAGDVGHLWFGGGRAAERGGVSVINIAIDAKRYPRQCFLIIALA